MMALLSDNLLLQFSTPEGKKKKKKNGSVDYPDPAPAKTADTGREIAAAILRVKGPWGERLGQLDWGIACV